MGGQTALPMAGSGQQAGGTPLGGTPIGGTPGQMGQPGMGSAASVMSLLQSLPGQQPGSTPRNIDTLPADFSPNPAFQQMAERAYQMGQPGMGVKPSGPMMTPEQVANMPGPSLTHVYQPSSANQTAQFQTLQNMMQGMPGQMGQPGMGQPTPLAGMTQQQLQQTLQQHYGLFPAAQPAGQPGMGSAASAMSQLQSPMAPPSGPRGVSSRQLGPDFSPPTARQDQMRQFNPSQMPQAAPMQRPEMAGGMPQQRPGFNMPQSFQDRLPPQFSQGLGALAQNMRNRVR